MLHEWFAIEVHAPHLYVEADINARLKILRHRNTGENGLMVLSKGRRFNGNMHLGNLEKLPKSPKVPKVTSENSYPRIYEDQRRSAWREFECGACYRTLFHECYNLALSMLFKTQSAAV